VELDPQWSDGNTVALGPTPRADAFLEHSWGPSRASFAATLDGPRLAALSVEDLGIGDGRVHLVGFGSTDADATDGFVLATGRVDDL
jgi:hypothetical protein